MLFGGKVGEVTVSEAGRKGGLALLGKRGRKHFAVIGKKGQEEMRKRYPGMASEWGRKGGRPRKNNL
jgi:general stress protein YciG